MRKDLQEDGNSRCTLICILIFFLKTNLKRKTPSGKLRPWLGTSPFSLEDTRTPFFLVRISISFSISIRLTLFLLVSSLAISSDFLLVLPLGHLHRSTQNAPSIGAWWCWERKWQCSSPQQPLYSKTKLALVAEPSSSENLQFICIGYMYGLLPCFKLSSIT